MDTKPMAYPDLSDEDLARIDLPREKWRQIRERMDARETALPNVGDPAPDFELPYFDKPDQTVRLSSFRGDRPVVLIFGSYT